MAAERRCLIKYALGACCIIEGYHGSTCQTFLDGPIELEWKMIDVLEK